MPEIMVLYALWVKFGVYLGLSINFEAVTACDVDVRLERKKVHGRMLRRRTSASGWTGQRKNGQPWQRKKAKKRAYNGVSFHCVS